MTAHREKLIDRVHRALAAASAPLTVPQIVEAIGDTTIEHTRLKVSLGVLARKRLVRLVPDGNHGDMHYAAIQPPVAVQPEPRTPPISIRDRVRAAIDDVPRTRQELARIAQVSIDQVSTNLNGLMLKGEAHSPRFRYWQAGPDPRASAQTPAAEPGASAQPPAVPATPAPRPNFDAARRQLEELVMAARKAIDDYVRAHVDAATYDALRAALASAEHARDRYLSTPHQSIDQETP